MSYIDILAIIALIFFLLCLWGDYTQAYPTLPWRKKKKINRVITGSFSKVLWPGVGVSKFYYGWTDLRGMYGSEK